MLLLLKLKNGHKGSLRPLTRATARAIFQVLVPMFSVLFNTCTSITCHFCHQQFFVDLSFATRNIHFIFLLHNSISFAVTQSTAFSKLTTMSFVSGKQDIIDLNVGGKPFVTSRATLCVIKGSLLEQTFSICKNEDSEMPSQIIKTDDKKCFIDRNPALFETVLSCLRLSVADSVLTVEVLAQIFTSHNTNNLLLLSLEANFFGLKCLQDLCDNVLKKKRCSCGNTKANTLNKSPGWCHST